jgi:endoglucanase
MSGFLSMARRVGCVFGAVVAISFALVSQTWSEERDVDRRAIEQNKRLGRGINVLGYDPIWKSPKEARFQDPFFGEIYKAGFRHIRVNLHPFRDASNGSVGEYYWETLDRTVQHALDAHLCVILDFHEFLEMAKSPAAKKGRFLATWEQIAERYRDASDDVFFEILNEPNGELTPRMWNGLLRETLAVLRKTNPTRTVIIGPGQWNSIDLLEELDLPAADRNLIATVHYYSPFPFTHQGTPWTDFKGKVGVVWNGTEAERLAIQRDFDRAKNWAARHRRPLYLGEFGAYDRADMASRVRYLRFVVQEAEKRGWSWAYWQFDSDFTLYDVKRQQWVAPLLEAIQPRRAN